MIFFTSKAKRDLSSWCCLLLLSWTILFKPFFCSQQILLTSCNTGIWSSVMENQYKQEGINPRINVIEHN